MSETDSAAPSPKKRRSGSETRQRDKQVKLSLLGTERAALEVLRRKAKLNSIQEYVLQKLESDPEYVKLKSDMSVDGLGADLAAVS